MLIEIIGWMGVSAGVFVAVPQLVHSYKAKSTEGLSKHTYQLLFFTLVCYLIKAIAIKELVFIVSNGFGLIVTSAILFLFKKYPTT